MVVPQASLDACSDYLKKWGKTHCLGEPRPVLADGKGPNSMDVIIRCHNAMFSKKDFVKPPWFDSSPWFLNQTHRGRCSASSLTSDCLSTTRKAVLAYSSRGFSVVSNDLGGKNTRECINLQLSNSFANTKYIDMIKYDLHDGICAQRARLFWQSPFPCPKKRRGQELNFERLTKMLIWYGLWVNDNKQLNSYMMDTVSTTYDGSFPTSNFAFFLTQQLEKCRPHWPAAKCAALNPTSLGNPSWWSGCVCMERRIERVVKEKNI